MKLHDLTLLLNLKPAISIFNYFGKDIFPKLSSLAAPGQFCSHGWGTPLGGQNQ